MAARKRGLANFVAGAKPTAPEIAILQDDIARAFRNQDKKLPFANGVLLEVEFTASALTQVLATKLDGACRGAYVVDIDAAETVFRKATTTNPNLASTHVELEASGACNAKVWVWR